MHVQDAVETLPDNAALPPRQPAQPEKTQRAVKVVGLSKSKKADAQKPPASKKSAGLVKPGKSVAKVGNSQSLPILIIYAGTARFVGPINLQDIWSRAQQSQ
jgi:hypothetical protein